MTKRRTPKQKAASRKNLEKARSARAFALKDRQFAMSGGTSKFVYLGTVNKVAKIRPRISENARVIRHYPLKKKYQRPSTPQALKSDFEKFLKGNKIKG